jgi:hypothetical protein
LNALFDFALGADSRRASKSDLLPFGQDGLI